MLAAAVRVDARTEADIGTVVVGNDRSRTIAIVNRLRPGLILALLRLRLVVMQRFEAIGRVGDRAPSRNKRLRHRLV